jgi:hypothetical protein
MLPRSFFRKNHGVRSRQGKRIPRLDGHFRLKSQYMFNKLGRFHAKTVCQPREILLLNVRISNQVSSQIGKPLDRAVRFELHRELLEGGVHSKYASCAG